MDVDASEARERLPPSPLTGLREDVELVRVVDTAQLIEGYKLRRDVDVAGLFAGVPRLRLLHDRRTGLSFFDPPVTGDAAFYAALCRTQNYHRPDRAEFRIAAASIPPRSSVLEVGAGTGLFAAHLKDPDYLGLEFNPEAAKTARDRGVQVVERDLRELAAERPASFDVTCAFQVLEHVADPLSMIEAMVALTRPGGRVILATPNADSFYGRSRDLMNAPPHHVTWWTDRTWHWLAAAFGLGGELRHTPIDEMLDAWAHMVASEGVARQLGLELDAFVDESPLRFRIDEMAQPIARTILAGLSHRADIPEIGKTTVALFTRPSGPPAA
jgi:SAM-dependent methyltransferase